MVCQSKVSPPFSLPSSVSQSRFCHCCCWGVEGRRRTNRVCIYISIGLVMSRKFWGRRKSYFEKSLFLRKLQLLPANHLLRSPPLLHLLQPLTRCYSKSFGFHHQLNSKPPRQTVRQRPYMGSLSAMLDDARRGQSLLNCRRKAPNRA